MHRTRTKTNQNDGKYDIQYTHTHTTQSVWSRTSCDVLCFACASKYCGHYFHLFFFSFVSPLFTQTAYILTPLPWRMHRFILSAYDFCGHFYAPSHAVPYRTARRRCQRTEGGGASGKESIGEVSFDFYLKRHSGLCTFRARHIKNKIKIKITYRLLQHFRWTYGRNGAAKMILCVRIEREPAVRFTHTRNKHAILPNPVAIARWSWVSHESVAQQKKRMEFPENISILMATG